MTHSEETFLVLDGELRVEVRTGEGAVTSAMREQAYELGGTLAALLME